MSNTNPNENLPTEISAVAKLGSVRGVSENLAGHVGILEAVLTRPDGTQERFHGVNARVNTGWSAQASALFVSNPSSAVFNWMALGSTAITPALGDTALANEITTNGGSRTQITGTSVVLTVPSSVGGTGSVAFSHTFTATGALTVNSCALLNQAYPGGTLYSEISLSSTATLATSDTLAITYTITF